MNLPDYVDYAERDLAMNDPYALFGGFENFVAGQQRQSARAAQGIGHTDSSDVLDYFRGTRNARTNRANSYVDALLGPISGDVASSPYADFSIVGGEAPAGYDLSGVAPATFKGNEREIIGGLVQTASAMQADPLDLLTAVSYETGGTFNPTQAGPTTQWGQHRGLIQFGEPQAQQYGVDWSNPIASQVGAGGAIHKYFLDRGWQPGMSGMNLYSIINAGAPGRFDASDANNGGAPGSVADKWNNQMADHRRKAASMLAAYYYGG
ncbi:MAG: hypothetical protein DI640_12920 [Sphingomonas taxi]|uniref:Uncharacterized protein n=1 Tax=Sphingomonas taxi TaxID=1549858 RepID=A0A2W5AP47_9SPHN|nr:MAG: hypothetical protein DI640_12920 [Sphingomonas taxi]